MREVCGVARIYGNFLTQRRPARPIQRMVCGRMKKLVFYTLVLVATLAVCRPESISCDSIPDSTKSDVGSSKSNKDQDIVGKSTQDSLGLLQVFWSLIEGTFTTAFGVLKNTVLKRADQYTQYMYDTTAEFADKFLSDVFSSIKRKFTTAIGAVTNTVYKRAGEFTEYVYNTTAEFAEKVRNTTAEFAEKVRQIFREEFSNFLAYFLWNGSVGDPASGKIIVIWLLKLLSV